MLRVLGSAIMATLALGGCGAGKQAPFDASQDADDDTLFVTCATDDSVPPYEPGRQVLSTGTGKLAIKWLQNVPGPPGGSPGPPVKGNNTWTVEVDDVDTGMALDGLTLTILPWMVLHNHGTLEVVVTTSGAPGQYTLAPMYLYMSGVWDVRFTILGAPADVGAATDAATIRICIP
jgi:YtkA-like